MTSEERNKTVETIYTIFKIRQRCYLWLAAIFAMMLLGSVMCVAIYAGFMLRTVDASLSNGQAIAMCVSTAAIILLDFAAYGHIKRQQSECRFADYTLRVWNDINVSDDAKHMAYDNLVRSKAQ